MKEEPTGGAKTPNQMKEIIDKTFATGDYDGATELAEKAKADLERGNLRIECSKETMYEEALAEYEKHKQAIEALKVEDEVKTAKELEELEKVRREIKGNGKESPENDPVLIAEEKIEEINKKVQGKKEISKEDLNDLAEQFWLTKGKEHLIFQGKEVPNIFKERFKDLFAKGILESYQLPKILKEENSIREMEADACYEAKRNSTKFFAEHEIDRSGLMLYNATDDEIFMFYNLMNKSDKEIEQNFHDSAEALGEPGGLKIIKEDTLYRLADLKKQLALRAGEPGLEGSLKEKIEKSIDEIDRISKITKGNETKQEKSFNPIELNNRLANLDQGMGMNPDKVKEILDSMSDKEISAVAQNIAESGGDYIFAELRNFKNKPEIIAQPEIINKFKEMLSSGRVHIYDVDRIIGITEKLPDISNEIFNDLSVRKGLIESSINAMKGSQDQSDIDARLPIINKLNLTNIELRNIAEELKESRDLFDKFVSHFGVKRIYPEV